MRKRKPPPKLTAEEKASIIQNAFCVGRRKTRSF
jgi:hypothetical protein